MMRKAAFYTSIHPLLTVDVHLTILLLACCWPCLLSTHRPATPIMLQCVPWPVHAGRSAHTMHLFGDVLYLMLGYAGSGKQTEYVQDCWTLPLIPDAYERMMTRARGKQLSPAAVLQPKGAQRPAAAAAANGKAGKRAAGNRSRSKSPLGRNSRTTAAAAAASGPDCEEASGWRVAKRQRSGRAAAAAAAGPTQAGSGTGRAGSGAAQQVQQQQQQQLGQQQRMPQPPFCEVLQPGQQQQPCPQSPGMAAAYAAAAAAAAATGGAYELRRPASPSYAGEVSRAACSLTC
jgi:hypothetical protein